MSGVLCVWVKYVRVRYVYKIGIPVYHLPNTRQSYQTRSKNTQYGFLFGWWVCKCSSLSFFVARSLFRTTQSVSVSFSLSCPPCPSASFYFDSLIAFLIQKKKFQAPFCPFHIVRGLKMLLCSFALPGKLATVGDISATLKNAKLGDTVQVFDSRNGFC